MEDKLVNDNVLEIVDCFKCIENIQTFPIYDNRLAQIPRYTIVIPVYKRVKLLKESILSAINQTTNIRYEIVVVDDNPKRNDDVELYMEQFRDTPNISYFKNERNLGLGGNWNRLIELTRSEFLIMLHDDDVLAPYYISSIDRQLNLLPDDVALLQTTKTYINKFDCDNIDETNYRVTTLDNLYGYTLGALTGGTYRKSALIKIGGWNQAYYPSLDYFLDILLMLKFKVYKSNLVGLYYRFSDNLTSKVETRVGFVYQDYPLQDAILKRIFIPKCIRARWLEYYLPQRLITFKLNMSDVPDLEMDRFSKFSKIISVKFVNWIVYKLNKHKLIR